MSFLKIVDPAKREQTVKEFLAIKKNIRANELAEKTGQIELQTDLSKFFKPITEMQKTTAKEITEGLRPIKEGIEQLPQRLPQQIGYPFSMPPSYRTSSFAPSEFEEIPTTSKEEEEEEEEEEKTDFDTTFGIYKKDNKAFVGNKQIYLTKDYIIVGHKRFGKTPGLVTLLTHKNPQENLIKDEDMNDYAFILGYTNAIHQGNNPKDPHPKASKSQKWKKIVKPIWESFKGKTGKGVKKVVIPGDPNALLEKLDLLMASKAAGNTGVRNEIVSVCDELKRQGVFDSKGYKKNNVHIIKYVCL